MAQWVRLHPSTARGRGSISRGKGKTSHAMAKKKDMSSAVRSVPLFGRCFRSEGEVFPGGVHGGRALS